MKLAIIGGSGTASLEPFRGWPFKTISTRYGEAVASEGLLAGVSTVFLPRHGPHHSLPPHLINYRANIAALKELEVRSAIGICAVGSADPDLRPGALAVLSDFIDFTHSRENTFHEGGEEGVVHTDFSQPYCPVVSEAIVSAGEASGILIRRKCVYLCVEGPRYETKSEIRMFRQWGADVVGMTNVPEVTLAREAGICYGVLAAITNFAAGISPTPLSHDEVLSVMRKMDFKIAQILGRAARQIRTGRPCSECARPAGTESWKHER